MTVKGNVLKTLAPVDASDVFKQYFRKQRDVNEPPVNTPLHVATLNGDVELVRRLIAKQKVDTSAKDRNDYTALHHAALLGRLEIVSILIVNGASINAAARDGNTPLHKAAQGGHVECTKMLLQAGADQHAMNAKGERPIDVCAMWKHTALTAFLRGYVGDS